MKINSNIVSKLYPTITSSLLIKKIFRQKSERLRILYDKKKPRLITEIQIMASNVVYLKVAAKTKIMPNFYKLI